MVGVDVVGSLKAKRSYRCVGLSPKVIGFAFDDRMLAIGFVPNRVNINAGLARLQNRTKLGPPLTGKSVTRAKGVFFDFHN